MKRLQKLVINNVGIIFILLLAVMLDDIEKANELLDGKKYCDIEIWGNK